MKLEQLIKQYEDHAREYYRKPKSGRLTSEVASIKQATSQLITFCGNIHIEELRPLKLRGFMDSLVRRGNSRKTINDKIDRIRRMYRWAASYEMIQPEHVYALKQVPRLQRGRTRAKENRTIEPVPAKDLIKSMLHMDKTMRNMVRVHYLTGMRPSELLTMRWENITYENGILLYRPNEHKTDWRGTERIVPLGRRVQKLIGYGDTGYVFTNIRGQQYTICGYRSNVKNACNRAKITIWSPLQLRHNAATRFENKLGTKEAQILLGHSKPSTTEIYISRSFRKSLKNITQYL
ncbi:tyrosine-type recombinase/integrase [Planctomycetota bacterium]|nr:tyrosine-type recombinase/integrase [Planctomycetota bacterium]